CAPGSSSPSTARCPSPPSQSLSPSASRTGCPSTCRWAEAQRSRRRRRSRARRSTRPSSSRNTSSTTRSTTSSRATARATTRSSSRAGPTTFGSRGAGRRWGRVERGPAKRKGLIDRLRLSLGLGASRH
ncbi:hypothetical protein EMIHUDRAFT_456144, partial [Emiliania huxleyi CCMP1516]|uniref:Uncharacterized protein n=2 Tax=Emiliania huxleyi TaxID=2903 RepID=A0A0D3K826_EMIH1